MENESTSAAANSVISSLNIKGLSDAQKKLLNDFSKTTGKAHTHTVTRPSATSLPNGSTGAGDGSNAKRQRAGVNSPSTETTASTPNSATPTAIRDFINKMDNGGDTSGTVKELAQIFEQTVKAISDSNGDSGPPKASPGGNNNGGRRNRNNNRDTGNKPGNANSERKPLRDVTSLSVQQRLSWLESQMNKHARIICQHDMSLRLDKKENQHGIELARGGWIDKSLDEAHITWKKLLPVSEPGEWSEHPLGVWRDFSFQTFAALFEKTIIHLALREYPDYVFDDDIREFVLKPEDETKTAMSADDTDTHDKSKKRVVPDDGATVEFGEYLQALNHVQALQDNKKALHRFYKLKVGPVEKKEDGTRTGSDSSIWIIRCDRASSKGRNILSALF
jgi:hypothetical protein